MEAWKKDMVSLKVLVDKTQNRVVFAEADNDFVDVLFSFLTLPMGTIVRLLRKQSESSVMGCINNLYASLEELEEQHFQSGKRIKDNLLRPKNSSEHLCRNLRLKIDDTERLIYDSGNGERYLLSEFVDYDKQTGGVFVKEKAKFVVTEDLEVTPLSSTMTFELLMKLGVQDISNLEEKILTIDSAEISSLLKFTLLSKMPLTDLMLLRQEPSVGLNSYTASTSTRKKIPDCTKMTLKIILRKSSRQVLYAEAKEDFVDHLLSTLTIPLGAIAELLILAPLGCISNVYKSVGKLSIDRDLKSQIHKEKLLSPKLSPQFEYKIERLGMTEFFYPQGNCKFGMTGRSCYRHEDGNGSEYSVQNSIGLKGFVEGPATFIVTDDLTVIPLSHIANISLLNKLNVPISDIEEQVVTFGVEEALKLLEASLTTTSALSHTFNLELKQPKVEK